MATVVNNTRPEGSNSGMGFLVGVIMLIVLAFLFFYYGLPMIQNAGGGTTVQVPEKVDVQVNTPNSQ